jgi:N-acetylglutamate synthase-like GNAT family acetyltransferase
MPSAPSVPVSVRRSTASDAAAIRGLIDQFVPDGTLLPRTESFIALNVDDFLVAVVDGAVVGCVHLDEYSPSLAELRSLAVDPAWQGKGIGRILVAATEKLALARDNAVLFAVSNDEEFFHRFGFERYYIPELDVERSEVSKYKGVYAKALTPAGMPEWLPKVAPGSVA